MVPSTPRDGELARAEWRLAMLTAVFVITLLLATTIIHAFGLTHRPLALPYRLAHLIIACAVTAYVWHRRKSPTRLVSAVAFTLLMLPAPVTFWAVETALGQAASAGTLWVPFLGPKIALFIIAALCPRPRWLAPTLMLVFVAEEVVLWRYLDLGASKSQLPVSEPWSTVLNAVLALTLYGYRLYQERRAQDLGRAQAEATMLRTINEAFLTVQDMANTPLQNLEIVLTLMKDHEQPSDRLIASASRAVQRLRELGNLVPAKEVTSASIDPAVLEEVRYKIWVASGERIGEIASSDGPSFGVEHVRPRSP